MGYLYKLVDQKEVDFAKDGIISLSHPIFEFKGSEGKFINFAHRIYDKYQKQRLAIQPSEIDLADIKEWIDIYKRTYGPDFKDIDIVSESMIIFCGIMQGYCGYFTTRNLDDENELTDYLSKSKLKDKIAYIRIDDELFKKNRHWRTNDFKKPFEPFNGDPNNLCGFNGFLHPTTVVYNKNYDDYNELLDLYNNASLRDSSIWFNNLPCKYDWQQEMRLLFLLRSLEKNSSRIGCDHVYQYGKRITTYEELVYCNVVDAIDYYSKGPRYIYLQIGKDSIRITYFKK